MAFLAEQKQNSNFAPKSDMPQGLHQVVIAKVEDLGMVKVNPTILAKNQAQRVKEGGDPSTVATSQRTARFTFKNVASKSITKDYNVSLHEKAGLYALILAVTGKAPGASFDLDTLVGAQAQAMVVSKTSGKGTVYTTINTIVAAAPGQNVAGAPPAASSQITDDDIPF